MENRNERDRLQEQQAPLKNTDKAFVQVSKDGSPLVPKEKEDKEKNMKPERTTDLDKR